jgi:hypothetical protein
MKRRDFIFTTSGAISALLLSLEGKISAQNTSFQDIHLFLKDLLKVWCDGMLAHQINEPNDQKRHGALWCEACNTIHGRCIDAVYPLMYMYELTSDKKYMQAGINAFDWERNVSQEDGSWTVMPDPKTWKGISVFGAIALAETLHFHGDLLPNDVKTRWTERLAKVGEYIFKNFDLTFTNINYGFSAIYALHLVGEVLHNEEYNKRSDELAKGIKNWLTEPHKLILGEGKPSDKKSEKGLSAVDLGYNVEETINGVVLYALEKNDTELIELLKKSLEGHLEFMLPDGAWDNSWGTRQYKWSYWGSRTTDGSQLAYAAMAHLNPAFGKAAYQNTLLLKDCTNNGLIHGGLHFVSHGVKPCIHHTFCHAKTIASLLNMNKNLELWSKSVVLPREKPFGIKVFPEIDVWLVNKGLWTATISTYDFEYAEKSQPASGGSLAVLYHQKAGAIFTASMAKYRKVEAFNQQVIDETDFALTPRLEVIANGIWYTNLFDLKAQANYKIKNESIHFETKVRLLNEDKQSPNDSELPFQFDYIFTKNTVEIKAKTLIINKITNKTTVSLVLPIVSKANEKVKQVSSNIIEIQKEKCTVRMESNTVLEIKKTGRNRVFNLVPGMEAVPIMAHFQSEKLEEIKCKIRIIYI